MVDVIDATIGHGPWPLCKGINHIILRIPVEKSSVFYILKLVNVDKAYFGRGPRPKVQFYGFAPFAKIPNPCLDRILLQSRVIQLIEIFSR